jgi:hypothetical protein
MCTSSIINTIGAGLQLGGLFMSSAASYNSSTATRQAYDYQAQVSRNNAQLAATMAHDATHRGVDAEAQQKLKTGLAVSSQRASMAARGLDLAEGTPLDILVGTEYVGQMEARIIRQNADREAWGYRRKAQDERANSELLSWRADRENPGLSAASTLLSGAGQVATNWRKQ